MQTHNGRTEMAYYSQTRTDSSIERSLSFIAEFFHSAAERYARNRVYRATLAELQAIDDRELADLGMNRAMLGSVAWQAALESEVRQR